MPEWSEIFSDISMFAGLYNVLHKIRLPLYLVGEPVGALILHLSRSSNIEQGFIPRQVYSISPQSLSHHSDPHMLRFLSYGSTYIPYLSCEGIRTDYNIYMHWIEDIAGQL